MFVTPVSERCRASRSGLPPPAASPTTSKRSGLAAMTSSAWVPIEPVLPRISTRSRAHRSVVAASGGAHRPHCAALRESDLNLTSTRVAGPSVIERHAECPVSCQWAATCPPVTKESRAPMRNVHRSTLTAATIAAIAVLGLSACSNDSSTSARAHRRQTTSAEAMTSAAATTTAMADPGGQPRSAPGCAAYAEQVPDGPGSVAGMAQDPVTVAASNNPMLKTLTQALSGTAQPERQPGRHAQRWRVHRVRADRRRVRQDRPGHDREAQDRLGSADQHPDLPRGARPGQPGAGRRARTRRCRAPTSPSPARATASRSTTPAWCAAASRPPTRRCT